jgi:hypothetical protein
MTDLKLIENYTARAEQFLNPFDWIPYVSSFSGMVRILAGVVEIAAATALAYIRCTKTLMAYRIGLCYIFKEWSLYTLHGLANMGRGSLAMLGWNLPLLIHDNFLGRMNYPQELLDVDVYPIMSAGKLAYY